MQLHEELKTIRLDKNISLKQVSNETKIRLDFLQRLEEGDYSVAPKPFVRAFIRSYAEVLGIDPGRAMDKLDNRISTLLPPPSEEPVRSVPESAPVPAPGTGIPEQTAPGRKSRRKKGAGTAPPPDTGPSATAATVSEPGPQPSTEPEIEPEPPREAPKQSEIRYSESRSETPPAAAFVQTGERRPVPERVILTPERSIVEEQEEEESHSVRNTVFAVIVVIGLVAAIVLIYMNRYTLF